MPHPLRVLYPGNLYEVTTFTMQGRFLLTPGPEANEIMLGVLGRALHMYPAVSLHAFVFLSNRCQLLVSARDGCSISAFVGHVNGNLARELGRLRDWPGPFWARRFRLVPVFDDSAQVARLDHLLSLSTTAGLATSPRADPWPSMLPGLLGEPLHGIWFRRNAEYNARRAGQPFGRYFFAERYPVRLAPLPCWAGLSGAERRARVEEMVARIDAAEALNVAIDGPIRGGRGPLDPSTLDPQARPIHPIVDPAPACHTHRYEVWLAFKQVYRAVCDAYRWAARRLAGAATVDVRRPGFPPGTFPPRLPFLRSTLRLAVSTDPDLPPLISELIG